MITCEHCHEPTTRPQQRRYCSTRCQQNARYDEFIDAWLKGERDGRRGQLSISRHVRRYVLERAHFACEVCGWGAFHPVDGRPLVQVDHRDGNAFNNGPTNLWALCPNCHAMTDTFAGRNRGHGRGSRLAPAVGVEPT